MVEGEATFFDPRISRTSGWTKRDFLSFVSQHVHIEVCVKVDIIFKLSGPCTEYGY